MAKVDRIEKIVEEENAENGSKDVELLQEFKDALIGVCRIDQKTIPVYSYIRLVELTVEDGIDEETAVESLQRYERIFRRFIYYSRRYRSIRRKGWKLKMYMRKYYTQ
jgi:hypothetical protein